MNKIFERKFDKGIFFDFCFFLVIAFVYFMRLPSTIQSGGDSGELAFSAYSLLVPHPPGYPLWVWLGHFSLQIIPWGTVYWKLALMNSVFSILGLLVIYKFTKSRFVAVLGVVVLGLDRFFWQYTEIPEAFSLNAMLAILIIVAAASERQISLSWIKVKIYNFVPFFFFLAAMNHHTIIFVVPVILWRAWRSRYDVVWYINSAIAFAMFCFGYWSMKFLDGGNLYSWNYVHDTASILHHFLRKDYGTFQLSAVPFDAAVIIDVYRAFVSHVISAYWPYFLAGIIFICPYLIGDKKIPRLTGFQWAVLISLMSYLILFFGRANIPPFAYGLEALSRFYLLPCVLLVILGQSYFAQIEIDKKYLFLSGAIALYTFLSAVIFFGEINDFSENTIVEDYAINLLDSTQKYEPKMLLLSSDLEAYAAKYVQLVLGHPNKTLIGNVYTMREKWFEQKVLSRIPDLNYKASFSNIVDDMFLNNVDKYTFAMSRDFNDSKNYKITFLPVGRIISQGQGIEFAPMDYFVPKFRSSPEIIKVPLKEFDPSRDIFAQYAFYFLATGKEHFKKGRLYDALDSFERALKIVPYCAPALENICKIKEDLKTTDIRCVPNSEISKTFPYYNPRL